MKKAQALEILQAVADGIDPNTGEMFPDDSPYHHPQIIRALFVAIKALENRDEREERRENLPPNAGKSWEDDEDQKLCDGFDAGMTIRQLAAKHQRTDGSIQSRLVKKGKIAS